MATYQLPGYGYVTETDANTYQLPGFGYLKESAASTAYTLTADAGSYTLTGVAATLTETGPVMPGATGTYTLTGVAASLKVGRKLSASSASTAVDNDAIYDAKYTAWFATQTASSTVYVRTTGNDTTGTGTSLNPYLTIKKGIQSIAAGGHVIVGDGTYDGPNNWISSAQVTIPSGTDSTHYTVIRAENRFGVRIRMTSSPSTYNDGPINLASTTSYVCVDGIIAESTILNVSTGDANMGYAAGDFGTHNKLTRVLGKVASNDEYGAVFDTGTGIDYSLLQDCHGFGSYRYMFKCANGDNLTDMGNKITRRCVGFGQYAQARQPTAIFSAYGHQQSPVTDKSKSGFLYQNCFAIGSPNIPIVSENKYSDFYFVKSIHDIRIRGCGSVGGGAEFGMFSTDNVYTGSDNVITYTDVFVVNASNGSPSTVYAFRKPATYGTATLTNYTVSGHPGSNIVSASGVTATLGLTSSVTYPVIRQSGNGAEVQYAHGTFMTEWGETGYDTLSSDPLWPFPYESYIKSLWAETIAKPTNDSAFSPAVPNSVSPLAGNSIDGSAQTLTKYIWESTGTQIPSYVYGGAGYVVSGKAALFVTGNTISPADKGTYTLTGVAANLSYSGIPNSYTLTAATGAFTETGVAANLLVGKKLTSAAGTFTETGVAAVLKVGHVLSSAVGTYAETGVAASLKVGHRLVSSAGAFTYNGVAAGTYRGKYVAGATGTYTATGVSSILLYNRKIVSAHGVFTLSGKAATFIIATDDGTYNPQWELYTGADPGATSPTPTTIYTSR